MLGKLQPPGGKRTSVDVKDFLRATAGLSDEIYAQRRAEFDVLLVAERHVQAAEYAQTQAACDLDLAVAEVDVARWINVHERQKQQREGERKAAQAAWEAELVREREEACVEADELAERMAQLKARHKLQSEDSDRRRRSLREELVPGRNGRSAGRRWCTGTRRMCGGPGGRSRSP